MIIFLLLLITFFGYLFVNLIRKNLSISIKIALGYIIGIGLSTYISFLLNILGIPFSLLSTLSLLSISILILVLLHIVNKIPIFNKIPTKIFVTQGKMQKILYFLIIFLIISAFISSIYWPVKDWDSIVLYDFRAKVFNQTGFMLDGVNRGYFFNYPLLSSIAHAFVYQTGFNYPGIIHSLFFFSLSIIIFNYLKTETNKSWALLWTFITLISPALYGHAQMTYTNLIYSTYLISSLLFLDNWLKDKNNNNLAISSMLLGLSIWTRSAEPFWIIPILLVFLFSTGISKFKNTFLYLILFLGFKIPWNNFRNEYRIIDNETTNDHLINTIFDVTNFEKISHNFLPVLEYFYTYIIKLSLPAYIILAIITFSILINRTFVKNHIILIILSIWLFLCTSLLGIFTLSLYYEKWVKIGGSAQRMSIFIPPLIMILTSRFMFNMLKRKNEKKD